MDKRVIESTASIFSIVGNVAEVRFDFDDIHSQIASCETMNGVKPSKIIIRFKRGDMIYGIPIKYATARKRK